MNVFLAVFLMVSVAGISLYLFVDARSLSLVQAEDKVRTEVRLGSSSQDVEAYLEQQKIPYSRLAPSSDIQANQRNIHSSNIFVTNSLGMLFSFDQNGKLKNVQFSNEQTGF